MKRAAVVILVLIVGAVGAQQYANHSGRGVGRATANAAASAAASEDPACWDEGAIRSDRFTLRGASGDVHDMTIERVDGCQYRVLVQVGERSLDYVAEFRAGEQPTFIRYNRPP